MLELGEQGTVEMDDAGIDMQVLSINAPGVEQSPRAEAVILAKETNDRLALEITTFPKRLEGFAVIPTAEPQPLYPN